MDHASPAAQPTGHLLLDGPAAPPAHQKAGRPHPGAPQAELHSAASRRRDRPLRSGQARCLDIRRAGHFAASPSARQQRHPPGVPREPSAAPHPQLRRLRATVAPDHAGNGGGCCAESVMAPHALPARPRPGARRPALPRRALGPPQAHQRTQCRPLPRQTRCRPAAVPPAPQTGRSRTGSPARLDQARWPASSPWSSSAGSAAGPDQADPVQTVPVRLGRAPAVASGG